jgi:probable F420-dependent oxidoreductase
VSQGAVSLGRVGIWSGLFRGPETGPADEAAASIEAAGFGALWIPGGAGGDIFAVAGRALRATRHLALATGILNVWMHTAAETAAGHAELTAAHPGRFLLGLGVSHAPLVEASGQTYARPLQVMTDYLDALDSPESPVPVAERALAALGPAMLALARDRSAGAHPYLVPPEHTAEARAVLGPGPLLATEQMAVLSTDREEARRIGRLHLGRYVPRLPNYTNNLRRLGFGEEDFADGGSDRLVDAIVVHGDEEAVTARVKEHLDAGADHVCVQLLTEEAGVWPLEGWRRLGAATAGLAS